MPLNDFGYAVKTVKHGVYTLSDFDTNHFLTQRWEPSKPDEYPVSYHNKGGKIRPRSINNNHLKQFAWLAISRTEQFEGAWCAQCVLFKTSDEGGGWSGAGQLMGHLVCMPLTDFSDLTGKEGCLSSHTRSKYHKCSAG